MLVVRKATPALIGGNYEIINDDVDEYFAFLRRTPDQHCLVILNYADELQKVELGLEQTNAKLVFSSAQQPSALNLTDLEVAPFEVLIVEL